MGFCRAGLKEKAGREPLESNTLKKGNTMEERKIELMEKIAQEALYALSKSAVSNEKSNDFVWSATNNIKVLIELLEKNQQQKGSK